MKLNQMSASEFAKYKLIMAAIKLFGESGVGSVSLREINREAGAKNNSALHYHFGTKLGLIEAVTYYIQDAFDREREESMASLEARALDQSITVEEIMTAHVDPYVSVIQKYDWGFNAVRAIARMEFDGDADVHKMLSKSAGPAVRREFGLLQQVIPDLPTRELKQRHNYVVNSIINGFADHHNLRQSYLGNLEIKDLSKLAKLYVVMATAALTAPYV